MRHGAFDTRARSPRWRTAFLLPPGRCVLQYLQTMGRLLEVMRSVDPQRELAADIEPRIVAIVARASDAWPGVRLDVEQFVLAIADRLSTDLPVASALDALQTDDLYLALGCAMGDPDALAGFEARCGPVI